MSEQLPPLHAEVEQLRSAGRPAEALTALVQVDDGRLDPGFVMKHFIGRPQEADHPGLPCLLLEAARGVRTADGRLEHSPQPPCDSRDSLEAFQYEFGYLLFGELRDESGKSLHEPASTLLKLRCDLVRLRKEQDLDAATIGSKLARIWAGYERAWWSPFHRGGTPPKDPTPDPPLVTCPFAEAARPLDQPLEACFEEALRSDPTLRRASPALPFLRDTLRYLWGHNLPTAERTVSTWIALVGTKTGEATTSGRGQEFRDGRLARLVVEAVPNGCGRLYPHPLYAGYLGTDDVFQGALAAAAKVFNHLHSDLCCYDFRWTVHVWQPGDAERTGRPGVLTGDSAGAAFYAAMRAAATGEPLDPRAVVTAAIDLTTLDTKPNGPRTPPVHVRPIGGLDDKVVGLLRERSDADWLLVDTVLVAASQTYGSGKIPDDGLTLPTSDWPVTVRPAADLESVYESLTAHGRIARKIKAAIATRAEKILDEPGKGICCPYVPPRLSRVVLTPDEHGREVPTKEVLSTAERDAVLNGRWPFNDGTIGAPRIRILADSGMGKSTLLVAAELAIARAVNLCVPIRLGAGPRDNQMDTDGRPIGMRPLDSIHWEQGRDKVFEQIAVSLALAVPDDVRDDLPHFLHRAALRGECVFLCDSVDQTRDDFEIVPFLNSVPKCPVLITGRKETEQTRRPTYVDGNWRDLPLEPFGEEEVRTYCQDDPELADSLLNDKGLAELVFVPVLLRQLRELHRRGDLAGIKNREEIYRRTMRMLLTQGISGITHRKEKIGLDDEDDVMDEFARLTWAMWPQKPGLDFSGVLEGAALTSFRRQYPGAVERLTEINVMFEGVCFEIAKGKTKTVAWRHFSYAEWFAGQHLATLAAAADDWGEPGKEGEAERFFQLHARTGRSWVFRFALSAADRRGEREAVNRMARWLIAYGNPFLLTEAVEQDRIPLAEIDENLDRFRRYLVFLEQFANDYSGSKAKTAIWPEPPDVDAEIAVCLVRMFALERHDKNTLYRPLYRDGRWMPMAMRLLDETVRQAVPDTSTSSVPADPAADFSPASPTIPRPLDFPLKTDHVTHAEVQHLADGELTPADFCRALRDQFLSEFENRVASYPRTGSNTAKRNWLRANRALLQLVPEECRPEFGLPLSLPRAAAESDRRDLSPLTSARVDQLLTWPSAGDVTVPEPIRDPETPEAARERRYRARRDAFNTRLKEHGVDWCLCPPPAWQHPYDAERDPAACTVTGVESPPDRRLPEGYWLGRTPVTNAQWETFDPYHRRTRRLEWSRSIPDPNDATKFLFKDDLDDHPVINVSWFDALLFCRWLTGRGKFGRFQLPNDWEWEACARAGRDGPGDEFGIPWTDRDLKEHFDSLSSREANFHGERPDGKAPKGPYLKGTCPVGGIPSTEYPANGFGLIDMHGQALEWQRNPYDSPDTDRDPEHISERCSVRGGDWDYLAWDCRCSFRIRVEAGERGSNLGLRLARTCPFTL